MKHNSKKNSPPPEEWDLAGKIDDRERHAAVIYELGRLKIQLSEELKCMAQCVEINLGVPSGNRFKTLLRFIRQLTTTGGCRLIDFEIAPIIRTRPWLTLTPELKQRIVLSLTQKSKRCKAIVTSNTMHGLDAVGREYKAMAPTSIVADWNIDTPFSQFITKTDCLQAVFSKGRAKMVYGFLGIDLRRTDRDILNELKDFIRGERDRLGITKSCKTGTNDPHDCDADFKRIAQRWEIVARVVLLLRNPRGENTEVHGTRGFTWGRPSDVDTQPIRKNARWLEKSEGAAGGLFLQP